MKFPKELNVLKEKTGSSEVEDKQGWSRWSSVCSVSPSLPLWAFRHHGGSVGPGLKSTGLDQIGLCPENETLWEGQKA